jgi:hypothetical protein
MSLSPKSKQKLSNIDNFSKYLFFGLLLSPFLVGIPIVYQMIMWDPSQNKNFQYVNLILERQERYFVEHGKFFEQSSNLVSESYLPTNYQMEIQNTSKKLIVSIRHKSFKEDKRKTSFGIINILNAKQIKQSNEKNKVQNKVQWQELKMLSFTCIGEKIGTLLPDNIAIAKVSNICPAGYKQLFISHTNLNGVKDR